MSDEAPPASPEGVLIEQEASSEELPPPPPIEENYSDLELLIKQHGVERVLESLDEEQRVYLQYCWSLWARPKQKAPGTPGSFSSRTDWRWWLVVAGRGFGKSKLAVEEVRRRVEMGYKRIALVGRTSADVRDVIIGGESGLLEAFPPDQRPHYEPSKRRVTFKNGAIASTYSADKPDQLRGPQHDFALCDEFAAWRYPDAFRQLEFGLRLGSRPQGIIATTPRPLAECQQLKNLLDRRDVVTVTGSTFENASHLPAFFLENIASEYGNTQLGRQELYGIIIAAVEGALWRQDMIQYTDADEPIDDLVRRLERIVVAVDPAGSAHKKSDMTGIVVAGRDQRKCGVTLADLTCKASPEKWAKRAVDAYYGWNADCIIAETNQGGDMVKSVIRAVDPKVPVKTVRASRGKYVRAQPIAAFYSRGRWLHLKPFAELESQMCAFVPGGKTGSPDRVDALVYAGHDLLLEGKRSRQVGVQVFASG